MNVESRRELQLLTEVDRDARVTQRALAKNLGVALGLTNLYLKRLAGQRYIATSAGGGRRIGYRLTPRGMAKKMHLVRLSLQDSLSHYRDIRRRFRELLSGIAHRGGTRIVIYGTGEVAEVAYLTALDLGLTLVGFVDGGEPRTFLSYPLGTMESLLQWEYDAVVVADFTRTKKIRAQLLALGVSESKLIAI